MARSRCSECLGLVLPVGGELAGYVEAIIVNIEVVGFQAYLVLSAPVILVLLPFQGMGGVPKVGADATAVIVHIEVGHAMVLITITIRLVHLVFPLQVAGIAYHRLVVTLGGRDGRVAAKVVDRRILSLLANHLAHIIGFDASLCVVFVFLDMVDGIFLRRVEAQAFCIDWRIERRGRKPRR